MIEVPASLWSATLRQVRSCGAAKRECVVYWVGPADDPHVVRRLVHPAHSATPTHYRVDDRWLTRFFVDLAATRESVRVQVHTHRGCAFHSRTDDEGAVVYQEGFLSLVLPAWARRDDCMDDSFLAELDAGARWHEVPLGDRLLWA